MVSHRQDVVDDAIERLLPGQNVLITTIGIHGRMLIVEANLAADRTETFVNVERTKSSSLGARSVFGWEADLTGTNYK